MDVTERRVKRGPDQKLHKRLGKALPSGKHLKRIKPNEIKHEKKFSVYHDIWEIVDGALRDTFHHHPEYLTEKGRHCARRSILKRVVGTLKASRYGVRPDHPVAKGERLDGAHRSARKDNAEEAEEI